MISIIRTPVLFLFLFFIPFAWSRSQDISIGRVEPPFWWTGMKYPELQLLVYGNDIALTEPFISYPGVLLAQTHRTENLNYLFIDLLIKEECRAGTFDIEFYKDGKSILHHVYEIKERKTGSSQRKGFDQSDVIYLIMPDRYANGNPGNDDIAGMTEKANRQDPSGRHGGDLQGIIDHLDYIQNLGVTSLWLNPFLENNNPRYSYHGYAITDFYRTDPRLGSNEDYLQLVERCHQKGMKIIMDMVFNHSSTNHWFIKDLPSPDWIHQFPDFTPSNFRASTITDPYASDYDKTRMLTGWFDRHMADLNQNNRYLTNYLIQNSIWWIEWAGLDGIRLDTQPYSNKEMIADWGKRISEEYPNFTIVGEAWLRYESMTAYYQMDSPNRDGYNSHIPCVTDFPLCFALNEAFTQEEGYYTGLARIYDVLAQDFLYGHPENNLVFVDNHDLTRFFTSVKEDPNKFKMGLAYILTTRGIPMIYYGTEILMTGNAETGHGFIRADFPGGWSEDPVNAFVPAGRTLLQNETYTYLNKLLKWRKDKQVIHKGNFRHFVPEDGIYTYFRYDNTETVMVIMNNNAIAKTVNTEHFAECMKGFSSGYDVINEQKVNELNLIEVPAKTAIIIELK
ncbi:MAG: glycoside hydrolase family 13 protein [Bacteroidetes bacterium]|nr:glycoside hydrolase family 13 protein [Bacteroidota bacterium]